MGLIVIVNVCDDAVQAGPPEKDGVTVMVAVTGEVPLNVGVNDGIFPVPLAAKPIDGLLFVQL